MIRTFLSPGQVDDLFGWPPGTAARLARRKRLPHYRLPDDSIRFDPAEVESTVRHVPLPPPRQGVSDAR